MTRTVVTCVKFTFLKGSEILFIEQNVTCLHCTFVLSEYHISVSCHSKKSYLKLISRSDVRILYSTERHPDPNGRAV